MEALDNRYGVNTYSIEFMPRVEIMPSFISKAAVISCAVVVLVSRHAVNNKAICFYFHLADIITGAPNLFLFQK